MRTVTYGAACSLDGFIATPDGGVDWLHFSRDVESFNAAFWKTVDTVLMGRKTWDVAMAMMARGNAPPPMPGITTWIFSRTLPAGQVAGATIVPDDAAEFLRDLKRRPGKGICVMGGGELAQSLFAADLIDEVGLNIQPVILGTGIPFFRDPGCRIPLTLKESRTLDGGCVLATYHVIHRGERQEARTTPPAAPPSG